MWNALLSSALKVRFALWAIDMALPSSTDLQRRYRSGLLGIVASVAAGMMLAVVVLIAVGSGGFALYYYTHVNVAQALLITMGASMAVIFALYAIGKKKFAVAFGEQPEKHTHAPMQSDDPLRDILYGFVEGFATASAPAQAENPESEEQSAAKPQTRAENVYTGSFQGVA